MAQKNIAARKKLEGFRAFFRFVHESGWIPTNPTTPPFTKEEVTSIMKACGFYPDKANRVRLRAFVLLPRYSGLRIRDAATLSRNRIQGDKLFLHTAKTGTAVYCPVPPFVIEALNAIPENTAYFSGLEIQRQKTAAGVWQEVEAAVYFGRSS